MATHATWKGKQLEALLSPALSTNKAICLCLARVTCLFKDKTLSPWRAGAIAELKHLTPSNMLPVHAGNEYSLVPFSQRIFHVGIKLPPTHT